MKIRWSPEAADDLQRICERIEVDNLTPPTGWPERSTQVATG